MTGKTIKWLIQDKGEFIGTREIRKHLLQYVKGFSNAKQFRSKLVHVKNFQDVKTVLDEILSMTKEHILV